MSVKRTVPLLFAGIAVAASVLAGCSGPKSAEMAEYKELGISQMEEGDYAGAAESFQNALDQSVGLIGDEEIDISYYKALALYMAGDADASLDTYTALIDFDPDNWETYYLRGTVYLEEGRESEALQDYADAASLNGESSELSLNISSNLGSFYYLSGDYDKAKTYLLQSLDMGEDEALGRLGEIAFYEEDYEGAISYLTRALDVVDESMLPTVTADLVASYEYSGDFESAYGVAAAFLEDHQDDAIEKEYEFLATRLGILPEVMEADTADPVSEEPEEDNMSILDEETETQEQSENYGE